MTGLEMDFPFTVGVDRAVLSVDETDEDIASEPYDGCCALAILLPPTSFLGIGFEAVGGSPQIGRAHV